MAATDLSLSETHPAFRKVMARSHPNLLVLERPLDERTHRRKSELTVDEIRRTVGFYGNTGGEAGWRIAIVDPADDMNASAANALLKVLEEPPARALFLIVSHAPGRALPTIRSRCRRLDVAGLAPETIVSALAAGGARAEPADLELAARLADGSLRRAILLAEHGGIAGYRALPRCSRAYRRSTSPPCMPMPTASPGAATTTAGTASATFLPLAEPPGAGRKRTRNRHSPQSRRGRGAA